MLRIYPCRINPGTNLPSNIHPGPCRRSQGRIRPTVSMCHDSESHAQIGQYLTPCICPFSLGACSTELAVPELRFLVRCPTLRPTLLLTEVHRGCSRVAMHIRRRQQRLWQVIHKGGVASQMLPRGFSTSSWTVRPRAAALASPEPPAPAVWVLPSCLALSGQCSPGQSPHSRIPSSHVGIDELLELIIDDQHEGTPSSTQHVRPGSLHPMSTAQTTPCLSSELPHPAGSSAHANLPSWWAECAREWCPGNDTA